MTVPRTLLVFAVLAAIGVAMYIFWTPIQIHYRLWRYRAGDAASPSRPHLCELGDAAVDPVVDAFREHGADQEMGNFRVIAAHTLRCLRRERAARQAGSTSAREVAYADVPLDESVEVIARAFLGEPNEARREQMKLFMDDLDFRARFRIYALLMAGPYPVPMRLPVADPHERHAGMAPEPIRAAWCRELAPVVRPILAGKGPRTLDSHESAAAAGELLGNRCGEADVDLMMELTSTPGPGLAWALEALVANPDRARFERVLGPEGPCAASDRFYSAMLQREPGLRAEAAAVVDKADVACLARRCPSGVKDCRSFLRDRLLHP